MGHHIIMVLDIMDIDHTDNHNNNVDIIIDIIIVINADTANNNSVDIIISAIIKNLATRKQALVRIWIMRDCVAMKLIVGNIEKDDGGDEAVNDSEETKHSDVGNKDAGKSFFDCLETETKKSKPRQDMQTQKEVDTST